MDMKQTIKYLFTVNNDYPNAQQALNLARSLHALSDDLYTDPIRYVFELIQNSDDSYDGLKTDKHLLRIAIVNDEYLIIANYGKPFDENGIRGICNIGCGTKRKDIGKTGYKGLGFKAVFGKSDYVLIASKGVYFRFEAAAKEFQWNPNWGKDQKTWETENNQNFEFPWQICPILTNANQIPKAIQQWLFAQSEAVATIIRMRNIREAKEAIDTLIKQPHVFMFLRYIKDIRISITSSTENIFKITNLKDGSLKICNGDNLIISHWLLHSCTLEIPKSALVDHRLPLKYAHHKHVKMVLATKIDRNDKIEQLRGSDSLLFSHLPTKISTYNLPILINSTFLVNASREHIHLDSPWNQWLFSCIPKETFKWIQHLTTNAKWCEKAYDLLPNQISTKDILAEKYNESCETSRQEIPFVINIDKHPLLIREAVIDITLFSNPRCIGHELIRDFIMRTSSTKLRLHRNPFVANNHRLRNLKVTQFTWEKCLEMLTSPFFNERFTPTQDIQFIEYLYSQSPSTQLRKYVLQLPFIMDQHNQLRCVSDVYFPSSFSSADWLMANNSDAFVHEEVMLWLNSQPQIRQWLQRLGVHEKTDMTFVVEHIVPRAGQYINRDNAMITICRLFVLFQHGWLTHQLSFELRKLKLFSMKGTLVPAYQLYFSAEYIPRLPLENFELDDSFFLSTSYLDPMPGVLPIQWKHFFQYLGVHEDIYAIHIDEQWYSELVQAYQCAYTMNLPTYVPYHFKNQMTILHIELTQTNYLFALAFWEHVMRFLSVNVLNEPEILFAKRNNNIYNLPQWCVRNRPCIPTTLNTLLPSTHIFSSNLKTIAGKYLPVFACNTPAILPEKWQTFFGFKTDLSITDYIQLLDYIYINSQNHGLDDDDERRIQIIYTNLMRLLSQLGERERDKHKITQPKFLLSTRENRFFNSNELVFSNSNSFTLPVEVAQIRLSIENSKNVHINLLLEIFKIRQVNMKDLSLSNEIRHEYSRALHTKLRNIQPYLFTLIEHRKIKQHSIDYDLEIYETDQLELYYNRTVPACQVNVHQISNKLFIKRPWNSTEMREVLPQILCQQFKLPNTFEQDIKFMLFAESIKDVNQYFIEQNIPIQNQFFEDLLSTGYTREKFEKIISRDNAKLFTELQVTETMTPAEVLLACLEAQDSEWSDCVYHFTHLENAAQILLKGTLQARSQLTTKDFKDSAAANVIQATRKDVTSYVRFYFRPQTPTQRCNENLGSNDSIERYGNRPMCPVPIFFCFNLRALLAIENLKWKVSLGNMASHHTEYDCTRTIVDRFDYQYVYADSRTERGKFSCQQEFLIESQLDLSQFDRNQMKLICQDEHALNSLKVMVHTLSYSARVDSHYFIGCNSRIRIQHPRDLNSKNIKISIENHHEQADHSQLIIQIVSNAIPTTITGSLIGIFYRDNIFTILGKEHISFIPENDYTKYAVYYRIQNQIWLIHTNYESPIYQVPEKE